MLRFGVARMPLTSRSSWRRWPRVLSCVLAGSGLLLAGCARSTASPAISSAGKLPVVAAENFWGSIASQLGGSKVAVDSIIVNPNTDPHSYEATASDGAAIARSRMAIVNGIGYDGWASKLIAANPASGRVVLDVGKLLGLSEGENPHQWYSPSSVRSQRGAGRSPPVRKRAHAATVSSLIGWSSAASSRHRSGASAPLYMNRTQS